MRKILYIIPLLFAFSFSGNPPGWYELTLPINDQVNDIYFTDSLNGWIVTLGDNSPPDTGHILHTSDGGNSWEVQLSHVGDFAAIQFLNNNTGYAYGFVGFTRFYKTTNGGSNWIDLSAGIPIFGAVFGGGDMQFINKDTGWLCSSSSIVGGGVAKTTNGGINWVQQLGTTERPSKLFFINADTGWALGSGNNLYRTLNGGTNWGIQYGFNQALRDIFMINNDTGWAIINNPAQLVKTTNGGFNWFEQMKPAPENRLNSLFFWDSKRGWIGGGFGKILKTTDGENWYNQPAPNEHYEVIIFLDTSIGFAGGTKMIKTTDGGGPTLITQLNSEIPSNFSLFQNYPNPFNPTTSIKFNVQSSKNVELSVYDIAGKEITTLVNEKLSAGEYNYLFDGSMLTSGIYFYKLTANGNIVNTKKMVLIK